MKAPEISGNLQYSPEEILSSNFELRSKPIRSKKLLDYIVHQVEKTSATLDLFEIYMRISNKTRQVNRRVYFAKAFLAMSEETFGSPLTSQIEQHLKRLLYLQSKNLFLKKKAKKDKKPLSSTNKARKSKFSKKSKGGSNTRKKGSIISRIYGRPQGSSKPIYNSPKS